MPTGHEPSPPSEKAFTAEDVKLAEHNAAAARERAARAGFSAAHSLEESAYRHERFAKIQNQTVQHKAYPTQNSTAVLRESIAKRPKTAAGWPS